MLWCIGGGPMDGDQLPAEERDADGLVARAEIKSTKQHLGDYVLRNGAWRWQPAPAVAKKRATSFSDEMAEAQRASIDALAKQMDEELMRVFYGNWSPR